MSANPSTTRQPRVKKPRPRFIVTKDGVECGFAPFHEVGLGLILSNGHEVFNRKFVGSKGILVKRPDAPTTFASEAGACIYINIAMRVRETLAKTVVDGMPKLAPVLEAGAFDVRPAAVAPTSTSP